MVYLTQIISAQSICFALLMHPLAVLYRAVFLVCIYYRTETAWWARTCW